jgi:hypothetical protein
VTSCFIGLLYDINIELSNFICVYGNVPRMVCVLCVFTSV